MADKTLSLEPKVLKDDPLFLKESGFDPALDAFNHEAYAQAILTILRNNDSPLSIGLIGPWGIGKSTVINILFEIIRKADQEHLRTIYFNAWKYSGDSFRRQFLIEAAKQVYEGDQQRDSKVLRLEQLNYMDVLREKPSEGVLKEIGRVVKTAVKAPLKIREKGIVRLVIAISIFAVASIVALAARSPAIFTNGLLVAVLAYFLNFTFDDLFIIPESPVSDPKLIFPEQFQQEFETLVAEDGPLGKKKAVIVIDDIDRCEPSTVRDILISIKTFLGHQNCFFVVPCDERSVVEVFKDPNQKKGYQDELLRKYFNVTVRMSPLMGTDLVDFANEVSKSTRIPAAVIQMAILANCRDARKMKHFLNSFAVKYRIAKAREERGFMPISVDDNIAGFAKAVLLEDLYPTLFEKMVANPQIYSALEESRLGRGAELLQTLGLTNWRIEYPGLETILARTKEIALERIDILFSLKSTNVQARVPRSIELENAIVVGDAERVDSILKEIPKDKASNVVDLLVNLLQRSTDQFLKNAVGTCLRLYCEGDLFQEAMRTKMARSIIDEFLNAEKPTVALNQKASYALRCAKDLAGDYVERVLARYEGEFVGLQQPNEGLAEAINAFYAFSPASEHVSSALNSKFDQWADTTSGLSTLRDLQVPGSPPAVPYPNLLNKIVAGITSKPNSQEMNLLRRQVAFKNWRDEIAAPFAERLVTMFENPSEPDYLERVQFVVQSILEDNRCIEPTYSEQLWPLIQGSYNELSGPKEKLDHNKTATAFMANAAAANVKAAADTFLKENWKTLSDSEMREMLRHLKTFEDPAHEQIVRELISQEYDAAEGERDNPTPRTIEHLELCSDFEEYLPAKAIENFIINTLGVGESAFAIWEPVIVEYLSEFETLRVTVATKILTLIPGANTSEKRTKLLDLFYRILPTTEGVTKIELLQKFFQLCEHPNEEVRTVTAPFISRIRECVDQQDFANRVSSLFRNMCDIAPTEIESYRTTLSETLKQKDLFGEHEWRDLAALIKRLVLHPDESTQTYGLDLLEQMPEFEVIRSTDLLHELENFANTDGVQKDRAANLLEKIRTVQPDS